MLDKSRSRKNGIPVTVRVACLDDLQAIFAVEKSAFQGGYTIANIRQFFDLFSDLLYVAETASQKVVGYVLGGITSPDQSCGWILSLAVDPDHQAGGIGQGLMECIHEQLHARGCREILLTVHPSKEYVIRFYERMGYSKRALEPAYFGPEAPRYVMQLLVEGHSC